MSSKRVAREILEKAKEQTRQLKPVRGMRGRRIISAPALRAENCFDIHNFRADSTYGVGVTSLLELFLTTSCTSAGALVQRGHYWGGLAATGIIPSFSHDWRLKVWGLFFYNNWVGDGRFALVIGGNTGDLEAGVTRRVGVAFQLNGGLISVRLVSADGVALSFSGYLATFAESAYNRIEVVFRTGVNVELLVNNVSVGTKVTNLPAGAFFSKAAAVQYHAQATSNPGRVGVSWSKLTVCVPEVLNGL